MRTAVAVPALAIVQRPGVLILEQVHQAARCLVPLQDEQVLVTPGVLTLQFRRRPVPVGGLESDLMIRYRREGCVELGRIRQGRDRHAGLRARHDIDRIPEGPAEVHVNGAPGRRHPGVRAGIHRIARDVPGELAEVAGREQVPATMIGGPDTGWHRTVLPSCGARNGIGSGSINAPWLLTESVRVPIRTGYT